MDEINQQTPLGAFIEEVNIAEKLSDEELLKIGKEAKEGFTQDLQSRESWEERLDEWTKLAKQTIEPKSYPWPKASNIKFPLLSTAAMQFAARAYPSLVPSDGRVVKCPIVGKDPDGSKTQVAEAVSIFMSDQLMNEMDGWEADMDRLLIMLPIVGCVFKKTYWDSMKQKNCSKLILPKHLVVDYWASCLEDAERISEWVELNERKVKERVQSGLWLDIELGAPSVIDTEHKSNNVPPSSDATTPYVFIEQHTFLDLDKDGYKEPYIVTFQKSTGAIVRIVARYDETTMFFSDGKLQKIEPIQYYTKFGFVPNPDGSFYDIGFGVLLGPLNESVNTLINQLVDAGSINNLQSGYIGKGLRLRMGETKFQPGEWKVVNSTGDDLRKQIVPLPSKEPSNVLLELMNILVTSGKELASVAEIFVGKMPGQNTPATTTMASIEQGMKVFTAVYKRIFRSLGEEFKKLYRLNGLYINPNTLVEVSGIAIGPEAFKADSHKIVPGADPNAVSQTEKMQKAQALAEMLGAGMPLDPYQVMIRMLEAQEQPNYMQLIPQQIQQTGQVPPKVDPKVQALQAKSQMDMQAGQQKMQILDHKAQLDAAGQTLDLHTKAQEAQIDLATKRQEGLSKIQSQVDADRARMATTLVSHQQDMAQSAQSHAQQMQHSSEVNAAKVSAVKAQAAAKPQPKGATKK